MFLACRIAFTARLQGFNARNIVMKRPGLFFLTLVLLAGCAGKQVFPNLDTSDKAAVKVVVQEVGDDPHEWFVLPGDLLLITEDYGRHKPPFASQFDLGCPRCHFDHVTRVRLYNVRTGEERVFAHTEIQWLQPNAQKILVALFHPEWEGDLEHGVVFVYEDGSIARFKSAPIGNYFYRIPERPCFNAEVFAKVMKYGSMGTLRGYDDLDRVDFNKSLEEQGLPNECARPILAKRAGGDTWDALDPNTLEPVAEGAIVEWIPGNSESLKLRGEQKRALWNKAVAALAPGAQQAVATMARLKAEREAQARREEEERKRRNQEAHERWMRPRWASSTPEGTYRNFMSAIRSGEQVRLRTNENHTRVLYDAAMGSGGCARLLEVYQYLGAQSRADYDRAVACGAGENLLSQARGPYYEQISRPVEVIDGYTPQEGWGDLHKETMKNIDRMERENRQKLTDPNDPRLRGRR